MTDYVDFNSQMWDKWSEGGNTWTIPVTHEEFMRGKTGDLRLLLTPQKPVPQEWYRGLGKKVLGLASGGGSKALCFRRAGTKSLFWIIPAANWPPNRAWQRAKAIGLPW
jgi:hypothetical protein